MDRLVAEKLEREAHQPLGLVEAEASLAASVLEASNAKVDVVDLALSSMSGSTSQPNLNSIVAALQNTPRDTMLDLVDPAGQREAQALDMLMLLASRDVAPMRGLIP